MKTLNSYSMSGLPHFTPQGPRTRRQRLPDADATVFVVSSLLFLLALVLLPSGS